MAHKITFLLLAVGGLNWLLYALTGQEIGSWVGGMSGMVAKVIYILVGLSAVYELAMHKKNCAHCQKVAQKTSVA
ncbi:MAG: Uncharacterized protein G01um101448_1115 [Parcubacteria group bacterium Gr01-1014_48]|nr:MAG: Uncharacterized protein Greene041614_412 [Parcubacteria group bacterium Greene0416_14]TSC71661.1 MAG: Uncharacterized protein G01um101448_1115 [Parcubacteria group bacterium Gr01-1014_48]TSD00932.1 MAG: Uncharacterized protein Greene101415_582 [Parcubacteria group bacterium Greene1014_15]TSD07884.1 MAG: Uncharacterized protein Greene07144_610 [Parcubacteria group bacterium Greene0714_4]